MSTGLECEFISFEGKHYYVLQDGGCPVNAFNWLEYATAYGPYATEEAADAGLSREHANPGGCCLVGEVTKEQKLYMDLIEHAEAPSTGRRSIGLL